MICTKGQITDFFFHVDEFYQNVEAEIQKFALPSSNRKYKPRVPKMADSEVMTILVLFHLSGALCLKHYYTGYIMVMRPISKDQFGKVYGDKGYVSQKLFE